jgi:MFS family permease
MTRSERTYYIVVSLYSGAGWFLGPVYPLFLLSRGLDLLQMQLVLATFLLSVFLLEVPTGAVADVFGRKVSFLLSCVVRAGAFALYSVADSFTDCLIAEVIDAVGMTLATGALDAWAVDGMRAEGYDGPVDRLFARAQMLTRALMVVGGVAGGYLASLDFAYAWLAAATLFAITGVIALVMMHDDRPSRAAVKPTGPRPTVLRTMAIGLATVRQAPVLTLLCVVSFGLAFGGAPAHMLWQPRLQELSGQGVWLMGWIWALINLVTLFGSWILPRLLAHTAREHILFVTTILRGAFLAFAAASTSFNPALIGYLMAELGFGVTEPILQAWMNDHIASEQRATVLSVRSMFGTLGGAIGLTCLGFVSRDYGIPIAWTACAAIFALTAPGFVALGRAAGVLRIKQAAA